jgi:hypothetical protein
MAIKYEVEPLNDEQIHQGDIFKNIRFYETYKEDSGRFELSCLQFPFAMVLTQECDLDTNLKERKKIIGDNSEIIQHDKFLVSLLCAPLYNAEHLFAGNHLQVIKIESEQKNSNQRNYIKTNRDPRYHYIEFQEKSIKLVPLIIDFKHYFSISLNIIEEQLNQRICSIKPIFRELITQRFSNFLSRIGLPEPKIE